MGKGWHPFEAIMAEYSTKEWQVIEVNGCMQVLYLDGVYHLPSELHRVSEIMEEKELRPRAPVEEVKLLLEAS